MRLSPTLLLFCLLSGLLACQPAKQNPETTAASVPAEAAAEYAKLQDRLLQGWNTWDNRSVLTQVLLPEGLGLILGLEDTATGAYAEHFFTGNRVAGTERVRTLAHTPNGSFTHLVMSWNRIDLRVRTAAEGEDLFIITSPDTWNRGLVHVKAEMIYGGEGEISLSQDHLKVELPERELTFYVQGENVASERSGSLSYSADQPLYISTKPMKPAEIKAKIDAAEDGWEAQFEPFGGPYTEAGQVYGAVQNAVNWLVVYDSGQHRLVTPVSRTWAYGWGQGKPGGFIQFCWDNFFVAWMHSLESKELAFNEAIQMTNYIDELGFVPNFAGPRGLMSRDRSQPPVGSMCIKKIYDRHPEKWLLEYTFNRLLRWNRFWDERRNQQGLLSWGSHPAPAPNDDRREKVQNNFKAGSYESGLDNTPMYDGVTFDTAKHMLKIQDVGLTGLYIMDCEALAAIAGEIGRTEAQQELMARAETFRKNLKALWDEDFGLFLNRHVESGELSRRISPTNFYALNGEAATQAQAERMMAEHFYNPEEFWGEYILPSIARNDTAYTAETYWRGSIWAPMNLLVYWGMENYELPRARQDLAEKSKNLLLKNWWERGWIRENYHAETGEYNPRSEHFYHWGALLGMIYLEERSKSQQVKR